MTDIGLGQRFIRIKKQETTTSNERLYILANRAYKLYKSRDDLIRIFKNVVEFESLCNQLRNFLIRGLEEALPPPEEIASSGSSLVPAKLPRAKEQIRLQLLNRESQRLSQLVQVLVQQISQLLANYKFFSFTFIISDREYLKFISKEMYEIKGLLAIYGVKLQ